MRIVSEGLTYTYNEKTPFSAHALNGVDLTVEEGEFFGIIGHTGSGKSTFIQHLNGLIPVMGGRLKVGETNMRFHSRKEYKKITAAGLDDRICFEGEKKLSYGKYKKRFRSEMKNLRAKVGMVFQYPEYQLFGETVFDDVAFGVRNFFPDYDSQKVELSVKEALFHVGLDYGEVKDKSPFDLSGGQKRRVAIAGVIVTRPQVLVLDEPVAGLDPQGKTELMSLLHRLHGPVVKTVIIVSHDMDEVAENCSRVAVFSEGKPIKVASPGELFRDAGLLEKNGLELPLTARLARALKTEGVNLDTDFTAENFISAVEKEYKSRLNRA